MIFYDVLLIAVLIMTPVFSSTSFRAKVLLMIPKLDKEIDDSIFWRTVFVALALILWSAGVLVVYTLSMFISKAHLIIGLLGLTVCALNKYWNDNSENIPAADLIKSKYWVMCHNLNYYTTLVLLGSLVYLQFFSGRVH